MPTSLLKEHLDVLLPFITRMCNATIQEGYFPPSQTAAIVTPMLKKPGRDASEVFKLLPNLKPFIPFVDHRKSCRKSVFRLPSFALVVTKASIRIPLNALD